MQGSNDVCGYPLAVTKTSSVILRASHSRHLRFIEVGKKPTIPLLASLVHVDYGRPQQSWFIL